MIIDGSRDLSDPWTGFTQFTLLEEKAPDGYMWSGWRLRKQLTFIDPEDKEFKETIKNARKKLETSVAPAMSCKIMKNCGSYGSDKILNQTCVYSGS